MSKHVAAIIPAHGSSFGANMDWPDYLMPVEPGISLLDRSVLEAAAAGVNSIWVVLTNDVIPMVKYRLGEWVLDPASSDSFERASKIPIFYVPIREENNGMRDTLAHNVIHGIKTVQKVAARLSVWAQPDYYYVTFPCVICSINDVLKLREELTPNMAFSCGGTSITSGRLAPFTIANSDIDRLIDSLHEFEGEVIRSAQTTERCEIDLEKVLNRATMLVDVEVEFLWTIKNWTDYGTIVGGPPVNVDLGIKESYFIREKDVGVEFCKAPFSNDSFNVSAPRSVASYDGRDVSGTSHKLSGEDGAEIRKMYATKKTTIRELSKMFKVSLMTIQRVLKKEDK